MRTRQIRPGYFKNEELARCDPLARILFAGLWCLADREGRLEDRPARIKAEALPHDDCDPERLLLQLQQSGFIVRYQAGGRRLIQVAKFAEHQHVHPHEAQSVLPECDKSMSLGAVTLPGITGNGALYSVPSCPSVPSCKPPLPPRGGQKGAGVPEESAPADGTPTAADVQAAWNESAARARWTPCHVMGKQRLASYRSRLADPHWVEHWREALGKATALSWLRGDNRRQWVANIDWFLRPRTVARLLEGYYDDKPGAGGGGGESPAAEMLRRRREADERRARARGDG